MNLSISTDTWICLSIIAVAFVFCFVFVFRHKNTEKLLSSMTKPVIITHIETQAER